MDLESEQLIQYQTRHLKIIFKIYKQVSTPYTVYMHSLDPIQRRDSHFVIDTHIIIVRFRLQNLRWRSQPKGTSKTVLANLGSVETVETAKKAEGETCERKQLKHLM